MRKIKIDRKKITQPVARNKFPPHKKKLDKQQPIKRIETRKYFRINKSIFFKKGRKDHKKNRLAKNLVWRKLKKPF
jgi:hypothetical protein